MIAPEKYLTTAGLVKVERHIYCPVKHDTRHVCPTELRAGIVEGFFTPAAARQAAYVVAHVALMAGEALFAELDSMRPSPSSLGRLPNSLSARWEVHHQDWAAHLHMLESETAQMQVFEI
jgi:hypothetical protein